MAQDADSHARRSTGAASLVRGEEIPIDASRESLATLGSIVAGVAHEVSNPLTYLVGNLTELERHLGILGELVHAYRRSHSEAGAADPEQLEIRTAEEKLLECGGLGVVDELLADALEGALRVREISSQLLSLVRPGPPRPSPLDVHSLLDFHLRLIRPGLPRHVALDRDFQALGHIESDAGRLGQVFFNLLHNAVQACDPAELDLHKIVVRTRDAESRLRIEIEDDGCGMSDETAAKALEPYFSTKDPGRGSGLGLSICRNLLEQLGGTLGFHPGPTRGTVFLVELPVHLPKSRD